MSHKNCPRCKNSEINQEDNFCKICGLELRGETERAGIHLQSTMDTKEVAAYLGVSLDTVRRWVHNEGLPVLRFPGRRKWIFKREFVDAWLEKRSNIDQHFEDMYGEEYGSKQKQEIRKDYGKLRVLMP